jgi:hypothetical protein
MPKASVVYWYAGSQMRLDGGGQRIVAWQKALETLGFECEIVGLRTIGGGVSRGALLSEAKRAVLPMPFTRKLPPRARHADVVIATVPAIGWTCGASTLGTSATRNGSQSPEDGSSRTFGLAVKNVS